MTRATTTEATLLPPDRDAGRAGPPPRPGSKELRWSRQGGVDVVVKAGAGVARAQLRREAEALGRLRGTRVVQPVELAEGPDHTELVLERYGAITLADTALMEPAERRDALVGLCAAVEELHTTGWAHNALDASHVLVGPRGRVRLCSLGKAAQLAVSGRQDRDRDLSDLATIVVEVLSAEATFGGSLQRARWRWAARRVLRRLTATRGLLGPGALSALLQRELPQPRARRRPGRRRVVEVAAVVVTLAVGAGAALAATRRDPTELRRPTTGADGPAPSPAPVTTAAASPAPSSAPPGPVTTARAVGTEVVTFDGIDYQVGEAGDRSALGDWDCDGRTTVAVFRPSTGEVFAYDAWASDGAPVTAERIGIAPGAVTIRVGEACGPPRVVWPDGSLRPIETAP